MVKSVAKPSQLSGRGGVLGILNGLVARRLDSVPSLYDVVPGADMLPRSLPRVEEVDARAITGTTRHPCTLDGEFLPIGHRPRPRATPPTG